MLNSYNIRRTPQYNNILSNIVKLGKNITNILDTAEIVYRIFCEKLPKYIVGQTKRSITDRIKEHKKCNNADAVISIHTNNFNHTFNWEKVKILDKESNLKKR